MEAHGSSNVWGISSLRAHHLCRLFCLLLWRFFMLFWFGFEVCVFTKVAFPSWLGIDRLFAWILSQGQSRQHRGRKFHSDHFRSFPIPSWAAASLTSRASYELQLLMMLRIYLLKYLLTKIDLSWKFCAPNGMSAKLILEVLCEWVDAAFGACPCCALTHPGSLLVANWDL